MVFVPVETAKFMVRQEIAELVNAKKAAAKKAPKKRR
jgi:hypothetical protein